MAIKGIHEPTVGPYQLHLIAGLHVVVASLCFLTWTGLVWVPVVFRHIKVMPPQRYNSQWVAIALGQSLLVACKVGGLNVMHPVKDFLKQEKKKTSTV